MDQLEMPVGPRRGRGDDALYSPVHDTDVDLPVGDAPLDSSPVHISLQSRGVRGGGCHAGIWSNGFQDDATIMRRMDEERRLTFAERGDEDLYDGIDVRVCWHNHHARFRGQQVIQEAAVAEVRT